MADTQNIIGQLAAIGFVLLLLIASVTFLKRKGLSVGWPKTNTRAAANQTMQLKSRLVLTGQHALFLVEVDRRRLIVATHPTGATVTSLDEAFASVLTRSFHPAEGAAE